MKYPRNMRKHIRQARLQGWTIKPTRGGHLVWIAPTGERVYGAATPSEYRGDKNFLARLRRAGYRDGRHPHQVP